MAHDKLITSAEVQKLYRDPKYPGSFGGLNKFLLALRKKGYKIRHDQLEKWLQEDDLYQMHKPSRKTFPRRPYIIQGIDHLWQVDLSDVSSLKEFNDGHRFLLFVIDCFSKYAWVRAIKDKTGKVLTEAMKDILSTTDRKPLQIQSDKGSEFVNRTFKEMLKSRGIHFYTSQNEETKAAFVERLQRTFKSKMYRFFTYNRELRYLDVLQDIMDSYNHTFHRTIGMSPAEVNKSNEASLRKKMAQHWSKAEPGKKFLRKGDNVRLSEARYLFGKGYVGQWSQEIFTVHKRLETRPATYQVKDWKGEDVIGAFYRSELQKVPLKQDRPFYVEKVLKTRKRGKRKQLYVKWEGYPKSFNSWIWEEDFV